jgi:hypothetical protein
MGGITYVKFLAGTGILLFATLLKPALGFVCSPIQWALDTLLLENCCRGMKLTIHLHIMLR